MSRRYDDLEHLKDVLREVTPKPDAERKAQHLAKARAAFGRRQENASRRRSTSEQPDKGTETTGTVTMPNRNILLAVAATLALGLGGLFVLLQDEDPGSLQIAYEKPKTTAPPSGAATKQPQVTRETTQAPVTAEGASKPAAEQETAVAMQPAPLTEPAIRRFGKTERSAASSMTLHAVPMHDRLYPMESSTEHYANAPSSALKITAEDPVSTFSIDVDTASYSIVRSTLNYRLPTPEQVRIEEMINYFPYDYQPPERGNLPFSVGLTVFETPWNRDTELVHIAIKGRELPDCNEQPKHENCPKAGRQPLNLVFLVDTSGSMKQPNKLPLLKQSLLLMLKQLKKQDRIAIVSYAGDTRLVLEPTSAKDRKAIRLALDTLTAGGGTAGQAGLQLAYATAGGMASEDSVSRVILATDGDFNLGLSNPEQLKEFIAKKRKTGIYLSVLGFGRGNLQDATMQALAQNGNGQAHYIDTLNEAQKALGDQLTGALFTIAQDVKIQVEFNPARVAEYRLIGYETRQLRREDFNNDRIDAGEIGAGHSVTAIYEITPVASKARLTSPLRYSKKKSADTSSDYGDEIGFLRLRYKAPGGKTSELIETPILPGGKVTDEVRFASAIAGFGELLRNSPYTGDWKMGDAVRLANAARGKDEYGYRAEAVQLMRLAESLQDE